MKNLKPVSTFKEVGFSNDTLINEFDQELWGEFAAQKETKKKASLINI